MAGLGPFNAYTDIPTLQASAPPIPITGEVVGLNSVLTQAVAIAATSLPVVNSAGAEQSAMLWILDGPNSEICFTDPTNPAPDNTHVTIAAPGTQFAHGANVSVSTSGTRGSLAAEILQASGWVEGYCLQGTPADRSLFSKSRTERLRMPTTRAMIDPWGSLSVRPRNFPVASVASISIETAPGVSVSFDPTQIELDSDGHSISVPRLVPIGIGQNIYIDEGPPVGRDAQGWCVLTYTAGLTYPNLPQDFQRAANLAVFEIMGYPQNPTGAAMVRTGTTMIAQRLRGSGGKESSADGLFLTQAKFMLEPYRNRFM